MEKSLDQIRSPVITDVLRQRLCLATNSVANDSKLLLWYRCRRYLLQLLAVLSSKALHIRIFALLLQLDDGGHHTLDNGHPCCHHLLGSGR